MRVHSNRILVVPPILFTKFFSELSKESLEPLVRVHQWKERERNLAIAKNLEFLLSILQWCEFTPQEISLPECWDYYPLAEKLFFFSHQIPHLGEAFAWTILCAIRYFDGQTSCNSKYRQIQSDVWITVVGVTVQARIYRADLVGGSTFHVEGSAWGFFDVDTVWRVFALLGIVHHHHEVFLPLLWSRWNEDQGTMYIARHDTVFRFTKMLEEANKARPHPQREPILAHGMALERKSNLKPDP